ncbi:SagB/ThcOx family dehydrogenase [Brevibacillus nitrificans]|uniref:SagB/ThcOx family dehydrogenase n=1 Tax=Brevibacillus nitrificans TaxID=651560 RepID=UPI00285C02A7|nr:SagB/ThcOx family dehydrogenase [Brevibacillus nitrificans]MDR7313772.1 SagB-type dehydrogenase family enzyme [Brevibacillus nitrificans]
MSQQNVPLLTISPSVQESQDQVLISDAWSGQITEICREELLDWMTAEFKKEPDNLSLIQRLESKGNFRGKEMEDKDIELVKHWWERKWFPSLEYYLWSRNYTKVPVTTADLPNCIKPLGRVLRLPEPAKLSESSSLGKVLMNRRSTRTYSRRPVDLKVFSSVLWYGYQRVRQNKLEVTHSIGVSFDNYIVVYSVEGISPGIYYYDISEHALILVREGEYREEMYKNLMTQSGPLTAGWTLFLVHDFVRFQTAYPYEAAMRHLFIEAGRIMQPLLLVGTANQLGGLVTPAIRDRKVSELMGLDIERQAPIYSITMGADWRMS